MDKKSYFPILIDLTKYKALVIGGGCIAERKVKNLLEFGAKPDVISPEVTPGLKKMIEDEGLSFAKRKYIAGDTEKYNLIFSATGDAEADKMLEKECTDSGKLLNVADVPLLCNFIMPATIKRGSLTFSIASQGDAPFLVKHLRKKLESELPRNLEEISAAASELRKKMIESGIYYDAQKREEIIEEFLKNYFQRVTSNTFP